MAMKIFDLLKLAFLNLYRRLSRSLLTVIGVVIGTACIVMMGSIGLTNLAQFDEMIGDMQLNRIEIVNANGYGEQKQPNLNDIAVDALSKIDNVELVVPQKRINFYAKANKYYSPYFSVIAVPTDALQRMIEIETGTTIQSESAMVQLVLGEGVAMQFIQSESDYRHNYQGADINWLETPIDLYLGGQHAMEDENMPSSRKYKAKVVGIIADEEENYQNCESYMGLKCAKQILSENYKLANSLNISANNYDNVIVYTKSMENVSEVLDVIRAYGFEANSNTEWINDIQQQQKAQQGQLAAIGLISLIVSAIGIANTMMTGIMERKKEIGVMKVIGVSIRKIRLLFLIESAIIGAIGGWIGVIISHLFSYMVVSGGGEVTFLGMYFSAGAKFIMPFWLDLSAILMAMTVGVLAGFFPARNATRMSPLEAVRA